MHRQISQAQREQIRKIIRNSTESKPLSKAKKHKHTQPPEQDKKIEHNPLKSHHTNSDLRTQTAYLLKQLSHTRIIQKLAMIERLTDKYLQKQEKKVLSQLLQLMAKEEWLRSRIDNSQRQNNKDKLKEDKDCLLHILQKQEALIQEAHVQRPQLLNINVTNSGVFTNQLIARETSPKFKIQTYGFSDLYKKLDDSKQRNLLAQLKKKDSVIKRLFQRIQTLEQTTSSSNSENKNTINENIESINAKLQESTRHTRKIRDLEQLATKQTKEYKDLAQNYRAEIETHKGDFKKLFEDYTLLQKQYKNLEEEFRYQMLEKEEWERKFHKMADEKKTTQHKMGKLVAEIKPKVSQMLEYDIVQMRTMHKIFQTKLKEELEGLKEKNSADFRSLNLQLNQQKHQEIARIGQWAQKCERLQNLLQTYQQNLLQLKLQNQELVSKLNLEKERKHIKGELISNVLKELIVPKQKILAMASFQTYTGHSMVQKNNQGTQNQPQNMNFSIQNSFNHTITHDKLCQEIQTDSSIKISVETFTQNKLDLAITNVLNNGYVFYNDANHTHNWTISKEFQWQFFQTPHLHHTQTQTQDFNNDLDEDFQDFKILQDSTVQKDCNANDILKLLQEAQQCTIVPQIAILREQLMLYREEIQRLKNIIRQHQKQKQQENVFNFKW